MEQRGKLVRDRIPEIIKRNGEVPQVRTLASTAYKRALREKLLEEAAEVGAAKTGTELLTELADVMEVLAALREVYGISHNEVEAVRRKRRKERGGFSKRIFLKATSSKP